jgi:hypothetical protein
MLTAYTTGRWVMSTSYTCMKTALEVGPLADRLHTRTWLACNVYISKKGESCSTFSFVDPPAR